MKKILTTVAMSCRLLASNCIPHQLSRAAGAVFTCVMMLFASKAGAVNILDNADLEGGWANWTADSPVGWNTYVEHQTPTHSGNLVFKVFGCWCGDPTLHAIYQDNSAAPGNTYTAGGWIYGPSFDQTHNAGWVEVDFLNASGGVIERYKSSNYTDVDPADTWIYYAVTNQVAANDVFGTNIIGTVSSLVAPAGTTKVRIRAQHKQIAYAGGAIWFDDLELNQTSGNQPPTISNISPNGTALFNNAAGGFTFNAVSATTNISASGITVVLNGLDISGSLSVTGPSNNRSVSYSGIKSNRIYSAAITVVDDAGFIKSASVQFDTFLAGNFSWEAEDYDFNNANYINSPVLSTNNVNSYYGTAGTMDVDWYESGSSGGGHVYRLDSGPGTEHCSDIARPQFAAAGGETNGVYDWDVGWTSGSDWQNYTRSYSSNSYNIYGRVSGGGGNSFVECWEVTSGVGTASQTTNSLGKFKFTSHGWQAFDFVPLTDASGNLVKITLNGVKTLRMSGNNANMNFFMVAPARDDLPVISNLYPGGAKPFEPSSTLSFNASSTVATIPVGNISVTIDGNNVTPLLTIGSNPTNRTVSFSGLASNAVYTATIVVTDSAGTGVAKTIKFDTFSESNFSFEAEDYDFDNGQYISSPVLSTTPGANNYYGQSLLAVGGVDTSTNVATGNFDYQRFDGYVSTEFTQDYLRQTYVAAQGSDPLVRDYNVGWWGSGQWMNYTRNFPAGTYNVYGRMASPSAIGCSLQRVTAGWGTSSQTTVNVGSFVGSAIGYQDWIWSPVVNGGSLASISLSGTNTLRAISDNGSANSGYYMLVPAKSIVALSVSKSGANPMISIPSQAGASYTLQYRDSLSSGSWQYLTVVLGDGTTKTFTDTTAGGSQRYYRAIIK